MKDFIAIHRFHSDASRKAYCLPPEQADPPEEHISKRAWVEWCETATGDVICRQHWLGDEIGFCHWQANSAQEILDVFASTSASEHMTIELHEQWRFVSGYCRSEELLEYKAF